MSQKKFEVIFAPSAEKDLTHLPTAIALQIVRDIKCYLETSPFPLGKPRIKKIVGYEPPCYRLRSGDYRAYYFVLSGQRVVVASIVHKKVGEKILKRLKKERKKERKRVTP